MGQYPLRPTYRPYGDQGDLDRVDLNEQGRRLKFTYKLHQNDNYNDEGDASGKPQRLVLDSTVVTNPACSYAIAVIHHGRMTLVPVRAMNQLRPDFGHVDKQAARSLRAASAPVDSDAPGTDACNAEDSDSSGAAPPNNDETALLPMSVDSTLATGAPVRVEYMPQSRAGKGGTSVASSSAPGTGVGADSTALEEKWTRLKNYTQTSTEAKDIYFNNIIWPAVQAAAAQERGEEAAHPKLQNLELDCDPEAFL